jgi:hypothetical protein
LTHIGSQQGAAPSPLQDPMTHGGCEEPGMPCIGTHPGNTPKALRRPMRHVGHGELATGVTHIGSQQGAAPSPLQDPMTHGGCEEPGVPCIGTHPGNTPKALRIPMRHVGHGELATGVTHTARQTLRSIVADGRWLGLRLPSCLHCAEDAEEQYAASGMSNPIAIRHDLIPYSVVQWTRLTSSAVHAGGGAVHAMHAGGRCMLVV